jgi:hypothetical protein
MNVLLYSVRGLSVLDIIFENAQHLPNCVYIYNIRPTRVKPIYRARVNEYNDDNIYGVIIYYL